MLSYRHAFHAGNHADVLKHAILLQVLEYMRLKEKPFLYVDTHAGAGKYDLTAAGPSKSQEFTTGIARIWHDASLPDALHRYCEIVRAMNPQQDLRQYPGSPMLAQSMMRSGDKARLFELHSTEFALLNDMFGRQRQFKVEACDGLQALNAVLPPQSRRAVVLIDPAYEVKTDYQRVVQTLKSAYQRFATGVYLLWYPVVNREYVNRLEREFIASGIKDMVLFELAIMPDLSNTGMTASGMIVINPPWQLEQTMRTILPYLQNRLGHAEGSDWRIKRLAPE